MKDVETYQAEIAAKDRIIQSLTVDLAAAKATNIGLKLRLAELEAAHFRFTADSGTVTKPDPIGVRAELEQMQMQMQMQMRGKSQFTPRLPPFLRSMRKFTLLVNEACPVAGSEPSENN